MSRKVDKVCSTKTVHLSETSVTMEQAPSPLKVRIPVIIMTALFGTGSWIAINGLWVELPLLVSLQIPENYTLASYLTVITQLANVGPLIFSITNYFVVTNRRIEIPTVFIILTIGCISSLLLIFFWDSYTVWQVDGNLHSTGLLVLAFFLSIVACTSSVTFTPFMSLLKNSYLTWFFIGGGLSSLLPSVMALIQGVGGKECVANGTYINQTIISNETVQLNCTHWVGRDVAARFPPQHFFGFLFTLILVCGIAFTMLNYLPLAKREHIHTRPASSPTTSAETRFSASSESHNLMPCGASVQGATTTSDKENAATSVPQEDQTDEEIKAIQSDTVLSKKQYVYLFVQLGFVCALSNGVLPSIQSFSCGPYGLNTYLLASTLANIANPVAATLVMLLPSTNLTLIGLTTLCGTVFGSYCMLTAALSPAPPLQGDSAGSALIIIAWVLMMGFFVYTKATIAWILRVQPQSRRLLIWYGGITQVGSMLGSFIMWPLVNVAHLFEPYYHDVCEDFPRCQVVETPITFF